MAEKEKARMKDFLPVHLPRDEFAKKIGLGLPSSSLALIEGEEGSGRSVVSQRLTYGLLENGFSVTYISTELTLKDFINQMYSMKYHVGPYLINTRLKFIPVLPIVGDQMPRQGYLQTLMTSNELYSSDVTVIDCMAEMLPSEVGGEQMEALLQYWKKVCYRDKVIIITSRHGLPAMDRLRQAADQYFDLEIRSSSYGIRHLMKVRRYLKARGKVDKMIEFRVEPDVGLIIEITEVSG